MPIIHSNYSLKTLNTFGIDVSAKYYVEINQEKDIATLFQRDIIKNEKLLVMGGGSNLLFTQHYEGLVIRLNNKGISVSEQGDEVLVWANAGEVWHNLVNYCVERGYAGLENLSLIPGTVGAAPVQNIGAYGVEIKDILHSCRAYEISSGKFVEFSNTDCEFSYRDSVFKSRLKDKYIISSVCFRLSKTAHLKTTYGAIQSELERRNILHPSIKDISEVVSAIRVSKLPDPSTIGNAGSFFKNPVISATQFSEIGKRYPEIPHYPAANQQLKLAAGWLIEQCGFKGVQEGHTGTWKNQALVLVNHGGASGQEIYDFSQKIIDTVQRKFGVLLEREVNIL
jgi:UDP-N-acetylmuramate dehydrogenase